MVIKSQDRLNNDNEGGIKCDGDQNKTTIWICSLGNNHIDVKENKSKDAIVKEPK